MKEITIDNFKELAENEIKQFVSYWKTESQKNKKSYPEKMSIGDWYEQFWMFDSEDKQK